MEFAKIENIIAKKLLGKQLSQDEQSYLNVWLKESPSHQQYYEKFCEEKFSRKRYDLWKRIDVNKAYKNFCIRVGIYKSMPIWKKTAKIAATWLIPFLLIGSGTYLYYQKQNSNQDIASEAIVPGSTEALLQWGNSNTIELNEKTLAKANPIFSLPTVKITPKGIIMLPRSKNKSIIQDPKTSTQPNVLQTSGNGEFHITLEDGTRVHLNYNTCLRFPEYFSESERVVYLEGEAFFDVAKDKKRPFKVVTNQTIVKEYGTSFNVNTYSPQRTEVVLVEGSIGVTINNKEYLIEPGELLTFDNQKAKVEVDSVNLSPYIAWHEGRFDFENESLGEIMETLSHWYNVKVIFEKPELKKLHFTGSLNRYGNLSSILGSINQTVGLHIETKERIVHINQ